MRSLLLGISLIGLFAAPALAAKDTSVGAQWERSLLTAKRNGTLPGPRPGQKCLYSKQLGGCLWYTPSKWTLDSYP